MQVPLLRLNSNSSTFKSRAFHSKKVTSSPVQTKVTAQNDPAASPEPQRTPASEPQRTPASEPQDTPIPAEPHHITTPKPHYGSEPQQTPHTEPQRIHRLPSQLRYDGDAEAHLLRVWRNTDLKMLKFEHGSWTSKMRKVCPTGPKVWVFWLGHFRTASFITNSKPSGWPRYMKAKTDSALTIPANRLSYKQMLDRSAGGPCWFVVGFFPGEITSTSFESRNPPLSTLNGLLRYGYLNQTNGSMTTVPTRDINFWREATKEMREKSGKTSQLSFTRSTEFQDAYKRLLQYEFPHGQTPSLFQTMLAETAENLDGKFAYIVARRGGNADSHGKGKKPWSAYIRHMHAVWVAARQAAAFNGIPIDPLSLIVRGRPDIMLPELEGVDNMLHGYGSQCAFGELVKAARKTRSTKWKHKLHALKKLGFLVDYEEGTKIVTPFELGKETNSSFLNCLSAHIVVSQRVSQDNNAFFSFLAYEYDVAIPIELSALSDTRSIAQKAGVSMQETLKNFASKIWWAKGYKLTNWGSSRDISFSCICCDVLAHLSSWSLSNVDGLGHGQNRVKMEIDEQLRKWKVSQKNNTRLECNGFLSCKTRNLAGWANHQLVRFSYMHTRWKEGSKYNDPPAAPIPAVNIASGLTDMSFRPKSAGPPSDRNQWYYSNKRKEGWITKNTVKIDDVLASIIFTP